MKRIAKNQLVGTMAEWAVFRDLLEDSSGKRVSVRTSHEFCITDERKPGEPMPSQTVLFAKHALNRV